MKQGQFNHLRLDNFSSLCSDSGSNVKRIRKSNESNKENTPDTPNHLNSMCGNVVGVGGFSIRSSTSAPTITCPLSNISNSNNEKSGSSNVDLIEEKLRRSNSGKAKKYQTVERIGTNILSNSLHQNFGVDGDLTCPPSSCVTTRVPLSNISNKRPSNEARGGQVGSSSLLKKKEARIIDKSKLSESSRQLFGLPKETIFEEEPDVDYNLDVASGQTAFLEEDDEMFYDGEMLYGTDTDEEDIVFGEKWCLTKEGYASLGPPSAKCSKCDAIMWKEERVNKQVIKGTPEFSLCCGKGQIKLPKAPSTPSYLMQLYNDPQKCHKFKKNIRLYNTMFAFTSMGGKVDHNINTGRAPYIYRLNGQNHHVFCSLLPNDNETPKFCQLYIYDTENEVQNRMKWVNVDDGEEVDVKIVEGLLDMLDSINELVPFFRMARDRFKDEPVQDLKIVMRVCRAESGRENFIGSSNEVGAIMVGDLEDTCGERDIIIDSKMDGLQRISDIHPKLMALQYPLLFPRGEDGYHDDIPYETTKNNKS